MQTPHPKPKPPLKWARKLAQWKGDLLHLIYPESCLACERELTNSSQYLCPVCETELSYTYFENFTEKTVLDQLFWGRVKLDSTCALLNFEKGSGTQNILHAIKYHGKKKLAFEMGRKFGGRLLSNAEKYGSIDALVPVPLHPKKLFIRGYNQSELIAGGIAKSMEIPVLTDFLTKGVHTASQTTKTRLMRWDNVSDVFNVNPGKYSTIKHIAIVDDVVTTGSTLEACIQKIYEVLPDIRITVLSLAIAK